MTDLSNSDDLASEFQDRRRVAAADDLLSQARKRLQKQGQPTGPSGKAQSDIPEGFTIEPIPEGGFLVRDRDGVALGSGRTEEDARRVAREIVGPKTPFASITSSIVDVAADIGRGAVEAPRQIGAGMMDAARNALSAFGDLAGFMQENAISFPPLGTGIPLIDAPLSAAAEAIPEAGDPESVTGGIIRDTSEFLTGFIPAARIAGVGRAATTAGKVGRATVAGAAADAIVRDPLEENLSNLIQSHPDLRNPVTEFLAAAEDDPDALARFKKALEGAGLGIAAEGFVLAIRGMRAARRAGRAPADAVDDLADARNRFGEVDERDFLILGDPNEPLVKTTKKPEPEKLAKGRRARKIGKAQKATESVPPEEIAENGLQKVAESDSGEIFVNFARIATADDVKQVIGRMAKAFAGEIKEAQRGVRSNEATQQAADDLGMSVGDILNRRQGQPFNAEEALAARRILAASAEKLLETAKAAATPNAGAIDQFNFRRMMAIHQAIQAEVIGARTETARALQAWSIPAGTGIEKARAIENLLDQMGGPAVQEGLAKRMSVLDADNASLGAINAVVRRGWAARTMDAVKESYVLGLLWSPATHMVNIGSNTAVAFQQIVERSVAARISQVIGREAGEGVASGEGLAMAFGTINALGDAFRLAGKAIRTGETGQALGKIDLPRPNAISSEAFDIGSETALGRTVDFIGGATRVPGRVLAGEDELFKTIGFRAELYAQALRMARSEGLEGNALKRRIGEIVNNPPENVRLTAADAALYVTFTNKPGRWAQGLMQLRNVNDYNPTFLVLPFLRTPANILRYSFERTPIAPLVGQWREDIVAGGARADVALARMATGTALMMVTADYAFSGLITGSGPDDSGEREALQRQGWQRNSIWIDGRWYSYNRTDPFGMLMGFSADMAEIAKRKDIQPEDLDEWTEIMAAGMAAVSDNVVGKSYFEGVSRVLEAVRDPERFGPSYINNVVGSFVPFTTALRTAERGMDPALREVNTPWDAVVAQIPGFSDRLPPRRDLWGQVRQPDEIYGRTFDTVSPIYVRGFKDSPIDAEIVRLGADIRRIRKSASILGIDINMRDFPKAYDAYVRLAGNDLKHPVWGLGAKDFLDQVVSGEHELSAVYQLGSEGDDGGKAEFIRNTIREFRELAARAVLDDPAFAEFRSLWEVRRDEKRRQALPVQ